MAIEADLVVASMEGRREREAEVVRQVLVRWERDIWSLVDSRRRVRPQERDLVVLVLDNPPAQATLVIQTREVATESTAAMDHFLGISLMLMLGRKRRFGEDCLVHLVFVRCGIEPICQVIQRPVARGRA